MLFDRLRFRSRRPPSSLRPHTPTPAPILCPVCPLTYTDWVRLASHARSHHSDLYICRRADCLQGFRRMADLRAHHRTEHRRNFLSAKCLQATLDSSRALPPNGPDPVADASIVRLLEALAREDLSAIALRPNNTADNGLLRVELRTLGGRSGYGVLTGRMLFGARVVSFPVSTLPDRDDREPHRYLREDENAFESAAIRRTHSDIEQDFSDSEADLRRVSSNVEHPITWRAPTQHQNNLAVQGRNMDDTGLIVIGEGLESHEELLQEADKTWDDEIEAAEWSGLIAGEDASLWMGTMSEDDPNKIYAALPQW